MILQVSAVFRISSSSSLTTLCATDFDFGPDSVMIWQEMLAILPKSIEELHLSARVEKSSWEAVGEMVLDFARTDSLPRLRAAWIKLVPANGRMPGLFDCPTTAANQALQAKLYARLHTICGPKGIRLAWAKKRIY